MRHRAARLCVPFFLAALLLICALAAPSLAAPAPSPEPSPATSAPAVFRIPALGAGAVPLSGAWQFHLGDDPSWSQPALDDATGHNGWEEIQGDATWGSQTHRNYSGIAWYRRHIDLHTAPGASPDIAMLIPAIDDAYQVYWNGKLVAHYGSFPDHLAFYNQVPAQTFGLGPIRSGVLAFRVYKAPLASNDDGTAGGFESAPILGGPRAIAILKDSLDYGWLRSQQFTFALVGLYSLVSVLSFIVWLRDRNQRLILWLALYTITPAVQTILGGIRLEVSTTWLQFFIQTSIQFREVTQWYLLIWLLRLNEEHPRLIRVLNRVAVISIIVGATDGSIFFIPGLTVPQFQILDASLTGCILIFEFVPLILVALAIVQRKKLDLPRWLVAIAALANGVWYSISNITSQGSRFTHWTIANTMASVHLNLFGSALSMQTLLRTVLFLFLVYAVLRYAVDYRARQGALEQELENARELQRVLVPEALPAIPGFRLTSAYQPAREVGGDFFQILALPGGSSLIVLGDVSGKGLRAAMAVSLIVGAIRTLAEATSSPAQILARLNHHLIGRLQGGFATCIAVRLDPGGLCTVSSAGHPGPFLDGKELELPGALPVGLSASASYSEVTVTLHSAQQLALYTDGLLEARSASGELYGFTRMQALFRGQPTATQATAAAVEFGQEDDITVLTLTRTEDGATLVSPLAGPA